MATDVSAIYVGCLCVLGHRDYGGLLETSWYYRLNQGHIENVSEDTYQLVSTRPGNPAGPAPLCLLTCLKVLLTSATEIVVTQSSGTADALMHASVLLA